MTAATAFPGATGLTVLDVYDWPCPDGLRGGSAHVHLASTEGYLVTGGEGRLQTLGGHGYAEVTLRPGDCRWFTPGTVHRLVNDDGALQITVVMQNAGLPEAGDAVLTFPPAVLADPERYAAAAALPAGPGDQALAAAARARRDLAIEGYLVLREQVIADGPGALAGFHAAAARLVAARVPQWRERWRQQAHAVAALTGQHLDQIVAAQAETAPGETAPGDAIPGEAGQAGAGQPGHLAAAALLRLDAPPGPRGYGMCGRLTAYPPGQARPVTG
jgi:mannose-6-phosphate isomerase-like protein (cupin superfamily)